MISIIIPTLDEEEYLPILLKEIKKQKFFGEYELIVADNYSTDKTREIGREFGCIVVDGGLPAKARNQGAKVAKGDIFLFIDADNILLPENFLNTLLKKFNQKNLAVASFPIYPKGKLIDRIIYGAYNNLVYLTKIPFATNSILVRRDVFEKVGGFDEEVKFSEDHCFVKQAAKIGRFGFIKTKPVLTSARRFERDGRFITYSKYIFAGIYMFLFGPIKKDLFEYRFFSKKLEKNK